MAHWERFMTSKYDAWTTPHEVFDALNREFGFTLDAAASEVNALCDHYYTKQDDGLAQDWAGEVVFCNPPYGRGVTEAWVRKCYEEAQKPNTTVVALLPSRTGTRWFHDYILGKAEIRFVRGRLRFGDAKINAPFDSLCAIWKSPAGISIMRSVEERMKYCRG